MQVRTQEEMNRALSGPHDIDVLEGSYHIVLTGTDSRLIICRDGVELTVVARESSQPRVVAWESSQPRVEAWESSQPRVVAWESSQPRVVARGYVQLSVLGNAHVKADDTCSILIDGNAIVEGGQQTRIRLETPREWCLYYGVRVEDGHALVYKALNNDFVSPHGTCYAPGTTPEAPDWDGGRVECGYGLHFSPTPKMAKWFNEAATKFSGCWVALADMAIHPSGSYPNKCKARAVAKPCFEVDEDGDPVEVPEANEQAAATEQTEVPADEF